MKEEKFKKGGRRENEYRKIQRVLQVYQHNRGSMLSPLLRQGNKNTRVQREDKLNKESGSKGTGKGGDMKEMYGKGMKTLTNWEHKNKAGMKRWGRCGA